MWRGRRGELEPSAELQQHRRDLAARSAGGGGSSSEEEEDDDGSSGSSGAGEPLPQLSAWEADAQPPSSRLHPPSPETYPTSRDPHTQTNPRERPELAYSYISPPRDMNNNTSHYNLYS